MENEIDDSELLLSMLAEVDEQLAISRGCVHDASNKFEEGKEFEVCILYLVNSFVSILNSFLTE